MTNYPPPASRRAAVNPVVDTLSNTMDNVEQTKNTPVPLQPKEAAEACVKPQAALAAIAIVAGLAELAYAVMNISAMPVYLHESAHYGAAAITGIGTAFLLCEGILKGPFGILSDRIGRKNLIIIGPLISVFTALLTLFVKPDQWYLFVLLRVFDGIGAAALWPACLAMIADVIPEEKRSQAMSLFNVTYLIGVAVGPFIGGLANDLTNYFTEHVVKEVARVGSRLVFHEIRVHDVRPYTASFYVVSVLFLLTALVAWWRLPNVRPHHEHTDEEATQLNFSAIIQSFKLMPSMMLMALTTFLGVGLIMLIIKLFAMAEFGVSETRFGALLLLPSLLIAFVSVPLGTIGDKIGRVRAVQYGLGICTLSMLALIFFNSQWALVIGGSIIGIGFVMAFPAWMAHISSSCEPKQRGAVMGAFGTAQGVGAMIGAPLGGFLYQHAHIHVPFLPNLNAHHVPFIGCTFCLFISWLIATFTLHGARVKKVVTN